MRIGKRYLAFVTVFVLLLSACGGMAPAATATSRPASTSIPGVTSAPTSPTPAQGPPSAAAAPTATVQPQRGGTVKIVVHSTGIARADPHQNRVMTAGGDIQALMYNSIVYFDRLRGVPAPSLAESWEYTSPTELVLRIRQGVKFQEKSLAKGRELDSTDVALSLDRTRQPLPFSYPTLERNLDKVEVVDKYTVRLIFKKADANYLFYEGVPGGVLPKEAIEKYGKMGTPLTAYNGSGPFSAAKYGATTCSTEECWYGTGPFVVDLNAYRADVSGAADRNPAYWDPGRPYLDRVTWVGIADRSSRIAALATGQLDIGTVAVNEKDRFEKLNFKMEGTFNAVIAGDYMALNNQVFPFTDWKVRKAFNLVADKEEQMAVVNNGYGCINLWLGCNDRWFLSWTDKEFDGVLGIRVDMKTNIAQAKDLLKQAGVDPNKLNLRHAALAASSAAFPTAWDRPLLNVAQFQQNLGVKVTNEALPACTGCTAAAATLKSGFELRNVTAGGRGGMVVDAATWETLHSQAATNNAQWNDPETDRLIEAQEGEIDIAKRRTLLHQLQRHLLKDGNIPAVIGARNYDYVAYNPKLRSWNGTGYFLNNYAWQFAWSWLEK